MEDFLTPHGVPDFDGEVDRKWFYRQQFRAFVKARMMAKTRGKRGKRSK